MWLRSNQSSVIVSPQGGSILRWQYLGQDILGPAGDAEIDGKFKTRGETHWCYPNFGSVPERSLWQYEKHGFLRHIVLGVTHNSESSVTFENMNPLTEKPFIGGPRVTTVVYDHGIQTTLSVVNDGLETIPVLPAIHPYFAVPPEGLTAHVGGIIIDPKFHDMSEPILFERRGQPLKVRLNGIGDVEVKIPGTCSNVVIWSDNPSKYVCLEPVFGRPGTFGTKDGKWLESREGFEHQVEFRLHPVS